MTTFLASLIVAAALGQAAQSESRDDSVILAISAGSENIIREPNELFSTSHPPFDLGKEEAFARCETRAQCEVPHDAGRIRIYRKDEGHCDIEIDFSLVKVRVEERIKVFVPRHAARALKAHEEGHAYVCREVFALASEEITTQLLKSFPKTVLIKISDTCTQETINERAQAALNALCGGFSEEISREIDQQIAHVRDSFDIITDHGKKNRLGRRPSASGQRSAAEYALEDFKRRGGRSLDP